MDRPYLIRGKSNNLAGPKLDRSGKPILSGEEKSRLSKIRKDYGKERTTLYPDAARMVESDPMMTSPFFKDQDFSDPEVLRRNLERENESRANVGAMIQQYRDLGYKNTDPAFAMSVPLAASEYNAVGGYNPSFGNDFTNLGGSPRIEGANLHTAAHEGTHFMRGDADKYDAASFQKRYGSDYKGPSQDLYEKVPAGRKDPFPALDFMDDGSRISSMGNIPPSALRGAAPKSFTDKELADTRSLLPLHALAGRETKGWEDVIKYPPEVRSGQESVYPYLTREGLLTGVLKDAKIDSGGDAYEYEKSLRDEYPIMSRLYELFGGDVKGLMGPEAYEYADKEKAYKDVFNRDINETWKKNMGKRKEKEKSSGYPNTRPTPYQSRLKREYSKSQSK